MNLMQKINYYISWKKRSSLAKLRHLKYYKKWKNSMASPNKLIYISPKCITYKLVNSEKLCRDSVGTYIKDGEWDVNKKELDQKYPLETFNEPGYIDFNDFLHYQSCREFFLNGSSWEETDLYKKYYSRKYNSEKIVRYKLQDYENIYHSIESDGYLTQKELVESKDNIAYGSKINPTHDEICVAVGRHGEFYHLKKGTHRTIISKILGIEKIPVRIILRHKKWQRIRKKIVAQSSNNQSPDYKQYSNHPDIQDLDP